MKNGCRIAISLTPVGYQWSTGWVTNLPATAFTLQGRAGIIFRKWPRIRKYNKDGTAVEVSYPSHSEKAYMVVDSSTLKPKIFHCSRPKQLLKYELPT